MSPASSRQEPVDPGTGEAWPRGDPRRPQPHVPAPWAPAPRGLTPASPGELAVNLCYGRGVAEQWRASSASTGPARWMTAPWLQEHPPPCPPTSLSRQHQPAIPVESSQVPGSDGNRSARSLGFRVRRETPELALRQTDWLSSPSADLPAQGRAVPEQLGRHASSPPRVHGPTPRDGVRPGSGTGTQRGDTLHAPAAPAWLRPDLCSWGAPAQEPLFPPRSQRPSKRSPSPARGCHLPPLQSQLPTPRAGVGAPTASQPTGQPAFPQVHRSRAHSLWWKVCPGVSSPPRAAHTAGGPGPGVHPGPVSEP